MTATQRADAAWATGELRVLIVDDDWDQAGGLAALLDPRGYQVAVAHSVDETRQRLGDFDAQLALIDIRLGAESGIDLVQELAQSHPGVLGVMITAYADLDNAIESLQQGVFDFLRKPLSPASLFVLLDRCACQIRLQHEKAEANEALRRIQWLLTRGTEDRSPVEKPRQQPYGDLSRRNTYLFLDILTCSPQNKLLESNGKCQRTQSCR